MLWKESILVIKSKDKNGKVTKINIIAGTLDDVKDPNPDSWAADPQNEVAIYTKKWREEQPVRSRIQQKR